MNKVLEVLKKLEKEEITFFIAQDKLIVESSELAGINR
jgi:hypothetical protein